MIAVDDMEVCRALIRTGSYSFHAASKLLPNRVRDPALALYAFCRIADDEVDEVGAARDKASAVCKLGDRLEDIYAGRPRNTPCDRAFAAVVEEFEMPRELPEALLEGLAWDAEGRKYYTLSDVQAYSARVASAVGAMMCVLMRVRDIDALARACDLGLAMQMSNIARDVGEDARAGRLFLPRDWMVEEGVDPEAFLANPVASRGIRRVTERLLDRADRLYWRAATGVRLLPFDCRPGILAAGKIYAAIGAEVQKAKFDSITRRAHTTKGRKLWLLAGSTLSATTFSIMPVSARVHAKPEPEVAYLVEAAARRNLHPGRSEVLISALMQLKARDRGLA